MKMIKTKVCGSLIMIILKICMECSKKLMVCIYLYAYEFENDQKFEFYIFFIYYILAREKVVGWYHTGPKLHQNDVAINELIRRYCPNSVLVIIDAKPKDLGLPTEAYQAVEEVHDVSFIIYLMYLMYLYDNH